MKSFAGFSVASLLFVCCIFPQQVNAFLSNKTARQQLSLLRLYIEDNNDDDDDDFGSEFWDDGASGGVVLQDLAWRVEKMRLEEQNKKRFLKAKPRFLPYKDACDWVQAWGQRWSTQQDWQDWIMDGEKRNSYIPSRPDEYYTRTGDWISWDHFLGVNSSDKTADEDF